MTQPFQPKGEVSEATMIYNAMLGTVEGELLTYGDLRDLLDRDFTMNRGPFYDALRRFENEEHGTFRNIPGKGYARVASGAEVQILVRDKQHRAGTQVVNARRKARVGLARQDLEPMLREVFEGMDRQFTQIARAIEDVDRRHSKRQKATEDAVAALSARVDRLEGTKK
jgi:hypothetical protein